MILRSRSLGEFEVQEDSILYFPDGLLGFEELKRYILVEVEEFRPFFWLLSVEEPEIGFAISDPQLFHRIHYEVPLSEADRDVLDLQGGDTISVFVIVSILEGGRRICANLKGPVVLNTRNRLGKQVVIYSPSYSVRQGILAVEEPLEVVTAIAQRGRAAAQG
jgi:flagellar assembly factor FliW